MSNMYGRQVVMPLTNKSGGGVIAGDVVIVDTANNDSFTTTTSANATGGVGIAQETIANNAVGRVLFHGYAALVNVSASVTRGNYGSTHTVAKQATSAGASRAAGTFCQFLTGGTTPTARIFSPDLAAGAGAVATDTIFDAKGDLPVGTGADTAAKLTAGTNGFILTADSSQATGLKWVGLASAAYKRNTGDYTIASGTFADIDGTNLSLTITTGARRVLVGFTGMVKSSVASGGTSEIVEIDLLVDGTSVGGSSDGIVAVWLPSTSARYANCSFTYMSDALTAASHTFKLQWRRALGSGTLTLSGASTGPVAQFWVMEQPS